MRILAQDLADRKREVCVPKSCFLTSDLELLSILDLRQSVDKTLRYTREAIQGLGAAVSPSFLSLLL